LAKQSESKGRPEEAEAQREVAAKVRSLLPPRH
jgi:hypothetical protein